jgi:2-amino-4-hydroxy-6-hydroxymethyldihydropteridine diphosphokinase
MKTVYLALGSNLGDRRGNLERAIARLADDRLKILRTSPLYETAPRYVEDQPWFLNQVVEAETTLFPRQLLSRAKKVERELGRTPTKCNGPRAIDVDVLLFGDSILKTADLEIPHPRIAERRFVLEPLAELAPELRHPVTRVTVREMLRGVMDQELRRA